jgi:hypothetical protein
MSSRSFLPVLVQQRVILKGLAAQRKLVGKEFRLKINLKYKEAQPDGKGEKTKEMEMSPLVATKQMEDTL